MLWYHEDLRKTHDLKERFYKIIRNKKKKGQRQQKAFITLVGTY